MKVLYHSIFLPNPWGHGGEKRSCQLQEMHYAAGIELVPLHLHKDSLTIRRTILTAILLLKVYGLSSWKSLYAFARRVKHLAPSYDQLNVFFSNSETDTFLWESTGEHWYFLHHLAIKHGKTVVAYPHNLESLVHGKHSASLRWNDEQRLHSELTVMRQCRDVYTISNEEAWFLQLMGVNAHYLPYQLPKLVQAQCEKIKYDRLSSNKEMFLMLGSAINPPTRLGMEVVIANWTAKQPLIVTGFGTEQIKNTNDKPNITILGTISDEQLHDLQIHCKALIIYQPITTGALTRIEEFVQAGIPVIVNKEAAQSYHERDGIIEYEGMEELMEVVAKIL